MALQKYISHITEETRHKMKVAVYDTTEINIKVIYIFRILRYTFFSYETPTVQSEFFCYPINI